MAPSFMASVLKASIVAFEISLSTEPYLRSRRRT